MLRLAGGASGILLSHQVAHVIRLLLLLGGQLIGCFGHRVEATRGVLLLHAAKQIGGLAQAVGGAAGVGRTGILGDGPPHVVAGLPQAVERLLRRLLAAVGGLLRGLPGIDAAGCTARLSARLPGSGTALTALLPLLSLLPLLALLAILSKLLLHLLLELLRLALQHFLLPLLLGGLGAVPLLLGQIFLAPGEFVKLFQRIVDVLGFLFLGGRAGSRGLVLIFLGIELKFEELG